MGFKLDINRIRGELNELPFRAGKREIYLGRLSELLDDDSEQAVADHLRRCEQALRSRKLILTRHDDDRDALFVVQELRTAAPDLSWMAEAMSWVSKITTVALEMVLPGLAGLWLDNQFNTGFLAVLGFVVGVPLGVWHVITMTKTKEV